MTGHGDGAPPGDADSPAGAAQPTGGDLTVSGGGSVQVATDAVFAEMAALRLLQAESEQWREQVDRVRLLGVAPAPGWNPGDVGLCVLAARLAVDSVVESSRGMSESLAEAAEEYGRLESSLTEVLRVSGSWLGHTLGMLAPVAALSLATPLAFLALGSLLTEAVQGRPLTPVPPVLTDWLRDNPRVLTSPVTVALVRALVSSVDDAALGRAGVPYPVAAALGDDGAGLLGPPSSALGLLVAARAAGMLRESPVSVQRVGSSAGTAPVPAGTRPGAAPNRPGPGAGPSPGLLTVPWAAAGPGRARGTTAGAEAGRPAAGNTAGGVAGNTAGNVAGNAAGSARTTETELAPPSPPTGFADLADRIPNEGDDAGQVRIERYGDAAHPSWIVYIGGTVEWSPTASTEPWDMTSNVTAVANQESGSYRAVLQALDQAGVQPGDPVLPVAHSQGGLIANELVSRGAVNAVGLVTFGAPETGLALPEGLPAIAIEHSDDLVPALGNTPGQDDPRVYVRREFFADAEVPAGQTLPAHQMASYRDTALLADGSPEPRLLEFRERLGVIVGTAPGQQSVWRARRVD